MRPDTRKDTHDALPQRPGKLLRERPLLLSGDEQDALGAEPVHLAGELLPASPRAEHDPTGQGFVNKRSHVFASLLI